MKTVNQTLAAAAVSIRPLDQLPITIDYFNGEKYTSDDGIEYPGYTPVVVGEISKSMLDDNYIDAKTWEALVYDAYYDVDAYVNKAMTVLGIFHVQPNFTAIPVITKDMMMKAIAAKVEQNLFTNPSNAEIRVTLTQNSGGRTTNLPARENFNPSDMLNQKVQEYINGSGIFELLVDSFYAITLDRNKYYTKEQIDAILTAILTKGEVPIEKLYTLDVENWEPTEDGDGVNKKYVDYNIEDLQSQINALITGDIELVSRHVKLSDAALESYTGFAQHQEGVNIENKIVMKELRKEVTNLNKRTGVPLQAYKTLGQTILSEQYVDIIDYDDVGKGTQDSLAGMNTATGEYTITETSSGDQVSFSANFKVSGKVKPNTIVGYATFFKNGEEVNHPVSGLSLEVPFSIDTIAGNQVSISAKDINIREGVEGEWNVGDKIKVVVRQTADEFLEGNELLVSDVNFDMANNRVLAEEGKSVTTDSVILKDQETESISGLSNTQKDINEEVKNELDKKLNTTSISREYELEYSSSGLVQTYTYNDQVKGVVKIGGSSITIATDKYNTPATDFTFDQQVVTKGFTDKTYVAITELESIKAEIRKELKENLKEELKEELKKELMGEKHE